MKILDFVAPAVPDAILDRIETEINSPDFAGMPSTLYFFGTTILSLPTSLAYGPDEFCRCFSLLLRMSGFEDESNNCNSARHGIIRLFQAFLSGTHASLDQRPAALRGTLNSGDDRTPPEAWLQNALYRVEWAALVRDGDERLRCAAPGFWGSSRTKTNLLNGTGRLSTSRVTSHVLNSP